MEKILSFVIPVKNEAQSLHELANRIIGSAESTCPDHALELIFIDDGSTDDSWKQIQSIATTIPKHTVRAIRFRRNLGKALALEAGFQESEGYIVFTLDADLQDDPKEIGRFLDKINEGFDLVSGWKRTRHDPISKTLPSKVFNGITSKLTGIKLNDFNCGFKCYRREVIKNIRLYGELHRYIPVLAADMGYRICEIDVEHHPRVHGHSKYGWERYLRGFIDLLTVLATTRWFAKPGHLFGGIGVALGCVGMLSLLYLLALWIFGTSPIGGRPLLIFGVLTTLASIQMVSIGIIAELFLKSNPINLSLYIGETLRAPQRVHSGLKNHHEN